MSKESALLNSDSEAPKSKPPIISSIPIGICYAASMGVCGNVLVGIGDALVEIADKVRTVYLPGFALPTMQPEEQTACRHDLLLAKS